MSYLAPTPPAVARRRRRSVAGDTAPSSAPIGATGGEFTPLLDLAGFSGSLGTLLELAQARRIDLASLSLADMLDRLTSALRTAAAQLAEKGDWVVIASKLVLLRSRLLLPPDEPVAVAAEAEAERLRDRLVRLEEARAEARALAGWLERRPRLGRDTFARGAPELFLPVRVGQPEADVAEFLWAAMALFEEPASDEPNAADAYRPPWLDIHSIPDARSRIRRRVAGVAEEGAPLAALLPSPEPDNPTRGDARARTRRRSAWGSSFAACLELAKEGAVVLDQGEAFGPIHVRRVGERPAAGVPERADRAPA